MSRLPLVGTGAASADPLIDDAFSEIQAVRGEVTNLFRVVANEPTLLPAFFQMSRRVRDGSTLPTRLLELAILSTALAIGSRYEIVQHLIAAERAGVSAEEIEHLRAGELSSFAPLERSVVTYARQVSITRNVDESTFQDLVGSLGVAGTVELAVAVGWYQLVAAIVEPLRLTIEPEKLSDPAVARLGIGGGNADVRD